MRFLLPTATTVLILSYANVGWSQTIRVNSGGPGITDNSVSFSADHSYLGSGRTTFSLNGSISGTSTPNIYKSGALGLSGYRFPVRNGAYKVKLHFREHDKSVGIGKRIFDLTVEGQTKPRFDIVAKAGGRYKVYVESFDVDVADGSLDIKFKTILRKPIINAVEVIEMGPPQAAEQFNGMCLHRTHAMALGDTKPSIQNIFDNYGYKSYAYDGPEFRSMGLAPDNRVALQMNVPQGQTARAQLVSRSLGSGVTSAIVSADVWIPSDFEFPITCGDPGKGRYPIGMWIGDPNRPDYAVDGAGGEFVETQKSISIRVNRSGSPSGQDSPLMQYVYNLNRKTPECETPMGNVCSVQCSSSACYGFQSGPSTPLPRGRWANVKVMVEMNTPGQANGCVTTWIDEVLETRNCGFDLGADRGWKLSGYLGTDYWHCRNSPKAQKWWLSNIKFYTPCQ